MATYNLKTQLGSADSGGTWELTSYPIGFSGVFEDICVSGCATDSPVVDTENQIPGEYVFTYTIGSGTCQDTATITIVIYEQPVITNFPSLTELCELCSQIEGGNYTIAPIILRSSDNQVWDNNVDGDLIWLWTITGSSGYSGFCSLGSANFSLNGTNGTIDATELTINDLPSCNLGSCQIGVNVSVVHNPSVTCFKAESELHWCKYDNVCAGTSTNINTCDESLAETYIVNLEKAITGSYIPVGTGEAYFELVSENVGNLPGYDLGDQLASSFIDYSGLNHGDNFTFRYVVKNTAPVGDDCESVSINFDLEIIKPNTGSITIHNTCLS